MNLCSLDSMSFISPTDVIETINDDVAPIPFESILDQIESQLSVFDAYAYNPLAQSETKYTSEVFIDEITMGLFRTNV